MKYFGLIAALWLVSSYADLASSHWPFATVLEMAAKQIVKSTSETAYSPKHKVTRAEFAAAQRAGIITGMKNRFEPERNITREEIATMIVPAYEYKKMLKLEGGSIDIKDKAKVST